jgi:hypothetical protein
MMPNPDTRVCNPVGSITQPVDRTLHEPGRDRFAIPARRGVMDQRSLVSLEIGQHNSPTRCSRRPMPAMSHINVRRAQRQSAASLRRHLGQRPCQSRHFARSSPRTASVARCASATPRPRAACSACSKRTAACHQSSTTVAFGSASRCRRHSQASPSHNTVAGVCAFTPTIASAWLNAPDTIAGLLRAKAKRDWLL